MNKIIRQRIAEEITTEIDNINVIIMDESFNMQFDKLYFAYVLLQRYQREVSRLILQEKVTELKERFRVILNKTIEGLKNEKSKKSSRTIFEQSQLIFNYLGLCYIHGLKSGIWNCSLTTQERRLIENAFGYFSLFDYMVLFWIKKMKIVIDIKDKIVEPLNKVEETYLYTHFFLTETDYFNKESKENNIEDLIKNVDFVIKEDLGDLVAELYWSLLYYHFKDDKIIPILRNYLKDKFISVESFEFSNYSEREKRHCKYSFICAFLEEMKQREIRYE